MLRAARWGDKALLDKTMRRRANTVNATDRGGATALIHASRNGHTGTVKVLLERGALDYIDCRFVKPAILTPDCSLREFMASVSPHLCGVPSRHGRQ